MNKPGKCIRGPTPWVAIARRRGVGSPGWLGKKYIVYSATFLSISIHTLPQAIAVFVHCLVSNRATVDNAETRAVSKSRLGTSPCYSRRNVQRWFGYPGRNQAEVVHVGAAGNGIAELGAATGDEWGGRGSRAVESWIAERHCGSETAKLLVSSLEAGPRSSVQPAAHSKCATYPAPPSDCQGRCC